MRRPIKNITEFGMFIGIEDGIDGLIHVSDISWTKKVRHPNELYKVGDTVQAKVLTVDQENEKFTLGVKQLVDDPWGHVPDTYPVGCTIKGVVTNITDFGLFVEVEEGIEGLVHVSELSGKKVKTPAEIYKEGQEIQAKVIHVSAEERRLGLSIKQTGDEEERRKPGDFIRPPGWAEPGRPAQAEFEKAKQRKQLRRLFQRYKKGVRKGALFLCRICSLFSSWQAFLRSAITGTGYLFCWFHWICGRLSRYHINQPGIVPSHSAAGENPCAGRGRSRHNVGEPGIRILNQSSRMSRAVALPGNNGSCGAHITFAPRSPRSSAPYSVRGRA